MKPRNVCRRCGEPLFVGDDLCSDCMKDFDDQTLEPLGEDDD
jgi:predicted amidophosphoribosyltransferase